MIKENGPADFALEDTVQTKAGAKTCTLDTKTVLDKMRATPVNDMFAHDGHIRADGLMVHDIYLFRVKKPSESTGECDLYTLVRTVKGDDAFLPLSESRCPLVKK